MIPGIVQQIRARRSRTVTVTGSYKWLRRNLHSFKSVCELMRITRRHCDLPPLRHETLPRQCRNSNLRGGEEALAWPTAKLNKHGKHDLPKFTILVSPSVRALSPSEVKQTIPNPMRWELTSPSPPSTRHVEWISSRLRGFTLFRLSIGWQPARSVPAGQTKTPRGGKTKGTRT